jgi:hypothetical protein
LADLPDEWNEAQVAMFTRMSRFMEANQHVYKHPAAPMADAVHWACVAHNAAWHAAEMLALEDDSALVVVDVDTEHELARETDGTLQ